MRSKGIAGTPKASNSSLEYLASYARIAIHIGGFSLKPGKRVSARAIKLRKSARLGY
jgi:hypothetical protein